MSNTISATNLGPIESASFSLNKPGVTVLVAPNGSGKSILLEAVQAAARGEGKLALRDRTKKGKVEAFGATITIGGTCRHTGQFEVMHLEGRFDLAGLVDPRLKSPVAADKARIKALVALTSVQASPELFRSHEAFEDFDKVVGPEALATDDLIDMAAKIKACYDDEALKCERRKEFEYGRAVALAPTSEIDMEAECDSAVLQLAYNEARDEVTRLEEQARNAETNRERFSEAKQLLDEFCGDELQREADDLQSFLDSVDDNVRKKQRAIEDLLSQVESVRAEVKAIQSKAVDSRGRISAIERQLSLLEGARKIVSAGSSAAPDETVIAAAKAEMDRASAAIDTGAEIRAAKANLEKIAEHRRTAKEMEERAVRYRDAGKSTDEVLSGCIKCPQLRVESDGKSARLVTDHATRGPSVPYHELSEGEQWTLAIDIGADQVGEGGLLVISQVGWEGIDGAHKILIHNHAVQRGVYILTAKASEDPEATREIVAKSMADEVPAVPKKPKPEPKAQKKAPPKPESTPDPVDDGDDEFEDLPF